MDTPFNKSSILTDADIFQRRFAAKITLVGSTVLTNLNAYSDNSAVIPYVEINGVQPTPADSDANFGTLDSNAAPSTTGILVLCQDAVELISATVPPESIVSGSMTAGVTTRKGGALIGSTTSYNLAYVVSCTGLDLDSAIANHSFWVNHAYQYKNV